MCLHFFKVKFAVTSWQILERLHKIDFGLQFHETRVNVTSLTHSTKYMASQLFAILKQLSKRLRFNSNIQSNFKNEKTT